MRVAILADIHGNLPALEAVCRDLKSTAPDAVYLAGDQIHRCPWNNEVMEWMEESGWPAIYGNHEWLIVHMGTNERAQTPEWRRRFPDLWWTHDQLRPHFLEWIAKMPDELVIDGDEARQTPSIRVIHGIPGDPIVGIMPDITDQSAESLLGRVEESIVVCAHTHRPLHRKLTRWEIFNPGSVGMPYNGDPRAHYLILDAIPGGWKPTWRRVAYDLNLLEQGFRDFGLVEAYGAVAELHLKTAMTGQPYASDFAFWMRSFNGDGHFDMDQAIRTYLQTHGPGRWAFGEVYEDDPETR
jgi:predicted phosphodiesterase